MSKGDVICPHVGEHENGENEDWWARIHIWILVLTIRSLANPFMESFII
jgi:hypothetical protein